MKKLSLTVKTLIACAIVAATASCSNKSETAAPVAAPAAADGAAALSIRFVDADSVISNYNLAKDLFEEQQREVLKLQQWHEQKQRELQSLANQISQKQQNSVYLSPESMQADVNNLQKKSDEAERYLATQQQRLANAELAINRRLSDSIDNFITRYNATRGYDAILFRASGVYFNPSLNITAEVIEGLNQHYSKDEK